MTERAGKSKARPPTRWRVHFAPTETSELGLGPPRWRLDLLYRRGGMPASYVVEWNDEERRLYSTVRVLEHVAEPAQAQRKRLG